MAEAAADVSAVAEPAAEQRPAGEAETVLQAQEAELAGPPACSILSKVYGPASYPEKHLADGCRLPTLVAAIWPQGRPEVRPTAPTPCQLTFVLT
jgi:hypothetical protein